MATLQGTKIKDTYVGILKMTDNQSMGEFTPIAVSDGTGKNSALAIAEKRVDITTTNASLRVSDTDIRAEGPIVVDGLTTGNITIQNTPQALVSGTNAILSDASFTNFFNAGATSVVAGGTIDFSGATVTGLPAASAVNSLNLLDGDLSLVAGTNITITDNGTDEITINAAGGGSPGLIDGTGTDSMASSLTSTPATASGSGAIALGRNARALGNGSICLGEASQASNSNSVMLGAFAGSTGNGSIALGWAAGASTTFSVGIGRLTNQSNGNEQVAIGNFARANQEKGIAIGASSAVNAVGGVALGRGVVNAKADTVSVTELETQLAGGGITMKSPNGTEYKLTVSDAGALVIT